MKISRKTIDLKLAMRPGEDDKTVKAYHVLPGLYAHKSLFSRTWSLTHHSGFSVSCCSGTLKECRRIAAIVQDMHPIGWTQEAGSIDTSIGGLWVKAYMAIENAYPGELEERVMEELGEDDMPFSNERLTWKGETVYMPTMSDVKRWTFDSVCEALDGCTVEGDGHCPHGAPSYLIALGMM